jgi:Carboxypeptidase regulatory-like domain
MFGNGMQTFLRGNTQIHARSARSLAAKYLTTISAANLPVTVLLGVILFLFAGSAFSQATGSGSIQGTVTDSTGALLPNASVALTETSTHVTLTTKTNSAGNYAFPNINVGTYSLTVTSPGFGTFTSTNNVLEVGSSIAIDAKLTVGSTETKVEVRTDSVALQTEDPSFKQTVDSTELTGLPLNGRTMTSLISLVGGTQNASVGDATGSKFPTQSTTISIAGAQGNAVSYRLDGGDNNDYMGGGNGPLPFPDAVGQFSVETAALSAQSGVQAGGLVNIVTQSGTNVYHGSAFWFVRNNYLNAQNFFSASKDSLQRNQYGGTLGGPIRIPKLFDGRNKLFFFAAYQHEKDRSSSATNKTYVPTADNLNGDFSTTDPAPTASGGTGVKNACGSPVQLYDPITGQLLPGNKYNNAFGPYPAVPLPSWNHSALGLIAQLPKVNPALDPGNCGLVYYAIPNLSYDSQFDTRVDYTIGKKDNFYARYFLDSNQIPSFYSPTNILVTSQSGNPEIRWQTITIGENHVFTPNFINTLHLTAVRRQLSRGFNSATPNLSAFGIKDFQAVPSGLWINCGSTTNNGCNTIGGGSNLLAVINDNIPFDIADDVTWILGKHQVVFGGSFVRNQLNVNNGYQSNGNLTINGSFSGGNGNLDLLEGALSGFNQSLPQQNALRGSIPSLYIQDTYHPSRSLTLTAGIRWAPLFFPVDFFHRGSVFDMAAFLANKHSTVYPNAPAGTFFYGDPSVKPGFTSNSPLDFSPNFGVSYDLYGNGKTVLRAGAAYAYVQPNFFVQQRVQQNPPFSAIIGPPQGQELCLSDPWLTGGSGNRGCGQTGGTNVDPFPINPSNFTFPQQAQYIVLQPTYKMPDSLQWTASVQQQLPGGWNMQIFYTGNRTQHQLTGTELNPAVYTPGVWGPGGTGCGPVVTTALVATAVYGTTGATLNNGGGPVGTPCSVSSANQTAALKTAKAQTNQQARLLLTELNPSQGNYYSGGSGGSLIETNNAYGNYNGVTVTVQHRFSSNFNLATNYTWSKCLNDADPQGDISGGSFSNPFNPSADYGPCGSDIRHNFNAYGVLRSHFPVGGVTGYLINNWELGPLVRLVSGTPFTVNEGSYDISFTGSGGDRPNLVPGVPIYNYTKIQSAIGLSGAAQYAVRSYLNQAAFTANTVPGTQGTAGRNAFRNPIYFQNDVQLSRIFPIHEKYNLDLRFEAFNVLNHPSFSSGNNSASVSNGVASFNQPGSTFGEITGTSVGSRVFQAAAKIFF